MSNSMSQVITLKAVRKWHLFLIWPATISVLIYVLSALAHPAAGWLEPQAINRTAPVLHADIKAVNKIADIITFNDLSQAQSAKLVPFKEQSLLQVTQASSPVKNAVTRYFSTHNASELKHHDETQAIWLAKYYAGESLKVNSVKLIRAFNSEYSASNRLLPVYKINFDTKDKLSVIVHTESMALVSISNVWRRTLKDIFRNFHAFDWLNDFEILRVLLISILLVLMLIMSITGFYFLILIKRRKKVAKTDRRWHRRLSYVLVLPLFLFSMSGFYHLFHNSLSGDNAQYEQIFKLSPAINLNHFNRALTLPESLSKHGIFEVSLIVGEHAIYRLNISKGAGSNITGNLMGSVKKHENNSSKGKLNRTVYFNALNGELLALDDQQLLQKRVKTTLNLDNAEILNGQLITHFGQGYSFKNKRLPVWRIAINDASQTHVFMDPVNHEIVDHNNMYDRAEALSFSGVHMYGWLKPIMSHGKRNMVFTVILSLSLILTVLGITLYLSNKRRSNKISNRAGEETGNVLV